MEKRLEETFKKEKKNLSNFIRSKISIEEDAEDILQDVFYQAVANANILESIDNLMAWLYTVAKNKIIDAYRKKKLPAVSIHYDEENDVSLEELIEDVLVDVEDDYIRSIVYDEIQEAIDSLPGDQKDIFVANELDGITFREFSVKSGIPVNTLLGRKRQAVINLKKKLQGIKELL